MKYHKKGTPPSVQNTFERVCEQTKIFRNFVQRVAIDDTYSSLNKCGQSLLYCFLSIVSAASTKKATKGLIDLSNDRKRIKQKKYSRFFYNFNKKEITTDTQALEKLGLIKYTKNDHEHFIQVLKPEKYLAGYTKINMSDGYWLLPTDVRNIIISAEKPSILDRLIDLQCMVVTVDPTIPTSLYAPTICLKHTDKYKGKLKDLMYYQELGTRWSMKKNGVRDCIFGFVKRGFIDLYTPNTHNGVLLISRIYANTFLQYGFEFNTIPTLTEKQILEAYNDIRSEEVREARAHFKRITSFSCMTACGVDATMNIKDYETSRMNESEYVNTNKYSNTEVVVALHEKEGFEYRDESITILNKPDRKRRKNRFETWILSNIPCFSSSEYPGKTKVITFARKDGILVDLYTDQLELINFGNYQIDALRKVAA